MMSSLSPCEGVSSTLLRRAYSTALSRSCKCPLPARSLSRSSPKMSAYLSRRVSNFTFVAGVRFSACSTGSSSSRFTLPTANVKDARPVNADQFQPVATKQRQATDVDYMQLSTHLLRIVLHDPVTFMAPVGRTRSPV